MTNDSDHDENSDCPHEDVVHYHDNSILCRQCNEVIWQGTYINQLIPEELAKKVKERKQ